MIQAFYPGALVPMPDGTVLGGGTTQTMDQFKQWYQETYNRPFTGTEDEANQVVQGFLAQQQQDMASQSGSLEGMFDAALPGLLGGALIGGANLGLLGGEATGGSMDLAELMDSFDSGFTGGEALMPPAIPETTSQLTEWGLVQDPTTGIWSMPTTGLSPLSALNTLSKLVSSDGTSGLLSGLLGGSGSLLWPLLGGLLGSQSGAKQAGTTTTVTDIPEWQKPYVTGLMDAASKAFGSYQAGAGPTQAEMLKTAQGGYLPSFTFNPFGQGNPYLEQLIDKTSRDVTGRVNASAYGSGAFGGSANQELLTRNLADSQNALRYQDFGNQANIWAQDMARNLANYQAERGRQFAATTGFPEFQAAQATSAFAPLQAYGSIVGRNFGSQTSQPYFSNPFGGALSGALGGLALSKAFG